MLVFIFGLLIGLVLPFLDSLVYVFFVNPQELTSQRVIFFLKKFNVVGAIKLLIQTKSERSNLVFHSNIFLVVALILGVWLMTSSGSFLGKGIIFGIIMNLVVDRLISRLYHRSQ